MHKSYCRLAVASVAFALSLSVSAQSKMKLGHVDTQKLITSMPEYTSVQKTLDSETDKIETRRSIMVEDFQKQVADYQQKAAKMTDKERMDKEEELGQLQQRIQEFIQTSRQDMQTKQQELLQPIVLKVQKAIQDVGVNEGYLYIFERESPLILFSGKGSDDVAPKVKQRLGVK